MNSYDIQVETGINSSKFEYVYDENEGRRVITQVKNYPKRSGKNDNHRTWGYHLWNHKSRYKD